MPKRKIADLNGKQFGKWKVLGYFGQEGVTHKWLCKCQCGREIPVSSASLRNGDSTQCRWCSNQQKARMITKHKDHGSCEYRAWADIQQRCYNPNRPGYKNYGARGITCCDEWRKDYRNFLADMGRRPAGALSIERINNDGPYSPDNCKWGTNREQSRNKTNTQLMEWRGKRMVMQDWSDELGIPLERIKGRLNRGWSVDRALSTRKIEKKEMHVKLVEHNGKAMKLTDWAENLGLHVTTIYQRLRRMDIPQALDMPNSRGRR